MTHISRDQDSPDRLVSVDVGLRLHRFMDEHLRAEATGECAPPMDVFETAEAVEIVVDVPGTAAASIRLVVSHGTIIVAGRKMPATCAHRDAAFQLAERSFGRFARAIRVTGAFDAGRASATLSNGELRVVLPRIEERRGRDILIDISAA